MIGHCEHPPDHLTYDKGSGQLVTTCGRCGATRDRSGWRAAAAPAQPTKMRGVPVPRATVLAELGDPATWDADAAALEQRQREPYQSTGPLATATDTTPASVTAAPVTTDATDEAGLVGERAAGSGPPAAPRTPAF